MRRRRTLFYLAALATWAVAARAQVPKVYRLGLLSNTPAPYLTDPLFAALRDRGWVLGKNLHLESRITGGEHGRAADLARELIEARADLIVTMTTSNAVAAKQVTSTVPIVMYGSGYPVEAGLAKSLAKPGGNVTGISVYAGTEMWGKYVSLARELVPSLRQLAVVFDYVVSDKELDPLFAELRRSVRMLRMEFRFWRNTNEGDLARTLSEIEKAEVEAMLVTGGPLHAQPHNVARINEFAIRRRLPMVNDLATNVFLGGGVLAYSFTVQEVAQRCANMVDRVLRGADPGTLPIEFPTKFELVINRKTARTLRLAVPQSLLVRADRIID